MVKDRLAAIFLLPAEQGNGFGRLMMDHAKSMRAQLELTVYEKNRAAIRFYKSAGFKIIRSGIDEAAEETELFLKYEKE